MNARAGAGIAALAVVLALCCGTVGLPTLFIYATQARADCPTAPPPATPRATTPTTGTVGPVGKWSAAQVAAAGPIVQVGQARGVPVRGWVIAVATAMQETSLTNRRDGPDDSVGLFQQRPSQGYGRQPARPGDRRTPEQRLFDPPYAAAEFFTRLLTVPNWPRLRLTDAAQAVQHSATPEAYQQHEADAEAVVAALAGVPSVEDLGGGRPAAPCGADDLPTVDVGPDGWTQPVRAQVGSGFRPPDRPGHLGVDLLAARFTPIHAAATGKVITAECNASSGTCDRDGSPQVKGCGWYVEIQHAGGVRTRYCHMVERPLVTVGQAVAGGQPLGRVGSSGNSSGPHLHFEVRVNNEPVDPVAFMAQQSAPLG